jgi:hypothetical protein
MIAGPPQAAVLLGPAGVSATRTGDGRSPSSSDAGPGAADVATQMPPHRTEQATLGPPPGPAPAGGSLLLAGAGVGDVAAKRALLEDLEVQRRRLAALAAWLLERGLAGEAVAAAHIEEAIASAAARLAA